MNLKSFIPFILVIVTAACNHTANKEGNENREQNSSMDSSKMKDGVYFVNLKNGDKVKSPVIIEMGVKGMTIEPAGDYNADKGHHHLIIDGSYVEKGEMVPKDETHLHFGKGQTSDTLKLSPGQHTLTLQFADGLHRSYGKEWSNTITITVEQ